MDLNALFNQYLKTLGVVFYDLPDEKFKVLKHLSRQLQDSIASSVNNLESTEKEKQLTNYEHLRIGIDWFVASTICGGAKNEQSK